MAKAKKKAEPKENGRPREHDYDDIALQILEWSKLDDSINFNGFCANYLDPPITPAYLCDMRTRDKGLSKAYCLVRARIADRREKMLNTSKLHPKAYDLNAKTYDYFMKKDHREEKEFDHNLKEKEEDKSNLSLSTLKELLKD